MSKISKKHRSPYTYEELLITIPEITNNEYKLVEKNGKDIIIRHLSTVCKNNTFPTTPNRFISRNQRCPICSHIQRIKSKYKTNEEFKKEVYDLVGNEYTFLEEYKGSNIKINVRHNSSNCNNYEYPVTPSKFLSDRKCPKCAGKEITTEEYKEKIKQITNEEFEFLDKYTTAITPSKFLHNVCGRTFYNDPNNFENHISCKYCNASPGEKTIIGLLEENKVSYLFQYYTNDCRGKRTLPFDFAILDNNDNLIKLIEFDGQYHYFSIRGEEQLKHQQFSDKIKDEYCRTHNIPFLRIPYWELDNIESILMNFCNKENIYA